jgi:lipid II:glycine glycyltransferase (peptidoglycan interpeptide bridge formation enzyme)
MRVPFARIGNTMWGVTDVGAVRALGDRVRVVERHTAVLDLTRSEAELLRGMNGAERKIRKAERERVEVAETASLRDVEDYCALARLTATRIRRRSLFTELPRAFFLDAYRHLGSAGYARLFLARFDGELIAGSLCLVWGDTMTYYHGASTRDTAHRAREASAACLWAAIRTGKTIGLPRFDLGGFTPTTDPADSRYGVWWFKSRWGGAMTTFYTVDVALSPVISTLQQRVGGPLWQRLHPAVWRLIAGGRR